MKDKKNDNFFEFINHDLRRTKKKELFFTTKLQYIDKFKDLVQLFKYFTESRNSEDLQRFFFKKVLFFQNHFQKSSFQVL